MVSLWWSSSKYGLKFFGSVVLFILFLSMDTFWVVTIVCLERKGYKIK